jgi:hypothetical protein
MQIGVFSAGGMRFGLEEEAEIVRNEPYQADAVTEMRQTLANGTHISQDISATVARDSEGRTVRIQKLDGAGPFFAIGFDGKTASDSSQSAVPILTTIFDPVNQEHIDYTSDPRIAHVIRMETGSMPERNGQVRAYPGPLSVQAGAIAAFPVPDGGPEGPIARTGPAMAIMRFGPDGIQQQRETTESIGTKTIEGVETVGTRRTWTIPTGAIGNDRALVTTEETWYASTLRLVLLSVRDDPRFGQTTYSLRNVRLTEPEKALFQIPAGYRIEDVSPPPTPPPADNSR